MKKRILSAFLCLCMMLTLAPAAFASNTGEGIDFKNIQPATLKDTGTPEITDLYTGEYEVTVGEYKEDELNTGFYAVDVTVTVNDLKEHTNADNNKGYWAGFFVPAIENAASIKYNNTDGGTPDKTLNKFEEMTDDKGQKYEGIAFYFNCDGTTTAATRSVAFLDSNGDALATVTYNVDLSGVKIYTEEPSVTPEMKVTLGENDATSLTATADTTAKNIKIAGKVSADLFGEDGSKKPVVTITFKGETTAYTGTLTLAADGKTATFVADEKDPAQELPEAYKDYKVVSEITVETTETPTSDMKLVSATYGVDNTSVDLNFAFDAENKKVINLTGKIDEALFADGKEVEGKLVYTLGSEEQKSYPFLLFLSVGKVDGKADGDVTLPDGYSINYAGITTTKGDEPTVELPKEVDDQIKAPVTNVDAIDPADQKEAEDIAQSVTTENTTDIANAAAGAFTDIVANEQVTKTQKVIVFLAVEAKEYHKENGEVTSVKLDITPKYQVVNKSDGSEINGKLPKDLAVTKSITLTVTLPDSFKNAANVFAKHLDASGNEKDRYKVTMDGITGTFTTKGFSEFEFTKDERTVTVHYYGISQKDTAYYPVNYTAVNIDSKHLMKHSNSNKTDEEQFIDTPVGESGPLADYTFKGWSTKENDTNVEYEAGALLTTTIFDKLYNAATNGVEQLYPVFVKEGSSDKPSGGNTGSSGSGGGGGSKRPDSSNNNNNTTTPTTPSDYGNNPSTPSTPSNPVSSTGFSDVVAGGWYESAVQYMKDNGLMAGTSATTFAPDATTTRGMIVTILYRLEKEPEAAASTFSDIAAGEWYSNAVAWAAANNIVSGYENGTFGANDVITREQMAAILFRYASFKGYDVTKTADISSFADAAQVSAYAADAMKWANAAGLISGTSATTLAPTGSATRAQAASILMRFCENVAK